MNTIVCVKQVLDPEIPPAKFKIDPAAKQVVPPPGVPPVISVYDERAVEAACRLKDKHKGKITVISMGSAKAADVIKHAISMGPTMDLFSRIQPSKTWIALVLPMSWGKRSRKLADMTWFCVDGRPLTGALVRLVLFWPKYLASLSSPSPVIFRQWTRSSG